MIVGNSSAGGARSVGIWDDLHVAGSINVAGISEINSKCI